MARTKGIDIGKIAAEERHSREQAEKDARTKVSNLHDMIADQEKRVEVSDKVLTIAHETLNMAIRNDKEMRDKLIDLKRTLVRIEGGDTSALDNVPVSRGGDGFRPHQTLGDILLRDTGNAAGYDFKIIDLGRV